MIFDSQEQKERVINLIGEVPVTTNINGLMSGPSPEMRELLARLRAAHVLSVDHQTQALILMEKKD